MSFLYLGLIGAFFGAIFLPMLLMEKSRRSLVLALRSLWLHKLRSFLSVLGIIIGTAAVIALMGFGEGSMQDALDDIKRQGATNVIIRSVKPPDEGNSQRRSMVATYGLTYDDYERFLTINPVRHVPIRTFPQEVRHLEHMELGRVVGTTPEYADVQQINLAAGRFLTEEDGRLMRNVVVLASHIAEKLFPLESPLGQTVRFNENRYVVVGVIRERMPTGGSGGSQAAEEFNQDVYIPLNTCKARYGEKIFIRQSGSRMGENVQLHQVTLTIVDTEHVRAAGDIVRDLLERHHLKKDWAVTVPLDRLEEAERAKNRYKVLLVFIASISLTVGGIGIMNIMLATVTERTREIGIRRALGAKRRDITFQFLVEAIVQTTVGGIAGVLLGLSIVYGLPPLASAIAHTNLPAAVNVESIFYSLAVAVSVGVLFGWYPAQRASRLDPIEALRHV
jgi:putative ABC transport system permease protein